MADDAIEWGKETEKEIILKERQGNFWRHWVLSNAHNGILRNQGEIKGGCKALGLPGSSAIKITCVTSNRFFFLPYLKLYIIMFKASGIKL